MTVFLDTIPVKAADVAVKALHEGVAWGVVGPRPARGARRVMRGRRAAEHHHSVGQYPRYLVKKNPKNTFVYLDLLFSRHIKLIYVLIMIKMSYSTELRGP